MTAITSRVMIMKKRIGLTLIEVIVSIAIIGIIAMSSLTIFDSGLRNIARAGSRTETVLEVKDGIDSLILTKDDLIQPVGGPTLSISDSYIVVGIDFEDDLLDDTTVNGWLSEARKVDEKNNIVYFETVIID
jgi:prepilin-type N-terminal cleavage/methylation domain-containing protein